jgi:lipopolysaccharide biosynthesis glycosyltransferase
MVGKPRHGERERMSSLIVCACDQNYFPMVKGLILSINESKALPEGTRLAFLDLGLTEAAQNWLEGQGVLVRQLTAAAVGELADASLGYQRAQACRPFLPKLFPEADTLVWMDSDMWVQEPGIFAALSNAIAERPDHLFIAPEWHYSYVYINDDVVGRHAEMFSYYAPVYGETTAHRMSQLPTLNSGFFAMRGDNPLWELWAHEVRQHFLGDPLRYRPKVRHMIDQIALNVIARRVDRIALLDPLYNYICTWKRPVKDGLGVVRVALAPGARIGIVHLAGGWKEFGEQYLREGLFYRGGTYLDETDMQTLYATGRHVFEFRE